MVKCSLMTFSFATIFLLLSNPPSTFFLDMDTDALSRIVEEHLDNYHVLVTHLTEIMERLHARNLYVYYHDNMSHSQLLQMLIISVNRREISPVIVSPLSNSQIAIKEGVTSLVITLIPSPAIDLNETFKHVRKRMHNKRNYYFLIIIEAPVEEMDISVWIRDLFQVFWLKHHLNVVLMYMTDGLRIISYCPFDKDFLRPLTNDTISIDHLFPDKVINMHLQPLHVNLFSNPRAIISPEGDLSGADGFMTSLMVERMNATLQLEIYTGPDPYGTLTNGSTTGSLRNVATGDSDVAFNMRFLIYSDFRDIVEATIIYGRDDLCILVPSSGLVPKITNILGPFNGHVWLMVVTIFIAVLIAVRCIAWTEKRHGFSTDTDISFLTFLRCHVNQTIPKISKSFRWRVFVVFWIFYCLIVNNAYIAHLTCSILLRVTFPEIDSLADLEKSNYSVLTIPKYANLIQNNLNYKNEQYRKLERRVKTVSFEEFHHEMSTNNRHVAYAHKHSFLRSIAHSKDCVFHDRPIYHLMKQCPVPFFTVYIVKYGSPYLRRINTIMRRAEEVGLTYHWEYSMRMRQKIKDKRYKKSSHGPIPLRLPHMQSAFYILGIGLVLALSVFIHEVCHKKTIWSS